MTAAKVFTSRDEAVAHVRRLGWQTVDNCAGYTDGAIDKRGRKMRLAFEWLNGWKAVPGRTAGDNFWWVTA